MSEIQELKDTIEKLNKENAVLKEQVSWWTVRSMMLYTRLSGTLALGAVLPSKERCNMEQEKNEKKDLPIRDKPTIGEIVRERQEEAIGFFWIMLFIIGFWTTFFILLDYFFGV
jgi:hypothetical protein